MIDDQLLEWRKTELNNKRYEWFSFLEKKLM